MILSETSAAGIRVTRIKTAKYAVRVSTAGDMVVGKKQTYLNLLAAPDFEEGPLLGRITWAARFSATERLAMHDKTVRVLDKLGERGVTLSDAIGALVGRTRALGICIAYQTKPGGPDLSSATAIPPTRRSMTGRQKFGWALVALVVVAWIYSENLPKQGTVEYQAQQTGQDPACVENQYACLNGSPKFVDRTTFNACPTGYVDDPRDPKKCALPVIAALMLHPQ